jgi:carbamoyl-phosphate synthase small subunit
VRITSHNHGFAVDPSGWAYGPDGAAHTAFGRVEVSHRNLNDDTVEGLRCLDVPAFSVQYHPEAAPGPHDAAGLFQEFRALIEARGGSGGPTSELASGSPPRGGRA